MNQSNIVLPNTEHIIKLIENRQFINKVIDNIDLNIKDKDGITLFETLCVKYFYDHEIINRALSSRIKINNRIKSITLCKLYKKYGTTDVIKQLLNHTQLRYDTVYTILCEAIKHNDLDMIKILVKNSIDNRTKQLILREIYYEYGAIEVVKKLLENISFENKQAYNILCKAARKNDLETVKKLFSLNKKLIVKKAYVHNLLCIAIRSGCNVNMVEYLFPLVINISHKISYHVLATLQHPPNNNIIKYLLDNGYNRGWKKALMSAATYNYLDTVKLYLKYV